MLIDWKLLLVVVGSDACVGCLEAFAMHIMGGHGSGRADE